MTAHILLPQIDPENPASLSRIMLDGVLRRRMRFQRRNSCRRSRHGRDCQAIRSGRGCRANAPRGNGRCHAVPRLVCRCARDRGSPKARHEGGFDEGEWRASLDRIERACSQAEAPGPSLRSTFLGCEEICRLAEGIRGALALIFSVARFSRCPLC